METIRTLWDIFGVWIFLALIIAFVIWAVVEDRKWKSVDNTSRRELNEWEQGFISGVIATLVMIALSRWLS